MVGLIFFIIILAIAWVLFRFIFVLLVWPIGNDLWILGAFVVVVLLYLLFRRR